MYDPFYYVSEKHNTMQNAAYGHHRTNPAVNNIVGDYKGKYKYATQLNKQVWQSLAKDKALMTFLVLIISDTLRKTDMVHDKVITTQSYGAALKLFMLFIQNQTEVDEEFCTWMQQQLPVELLKSEDDKMQEILHHLSSLVHSSSGDSPMQDL